MARPIALRGSAGLHLRALPVARSPRRTGAALDSPRWPRTAGRSGEAARPTRAVLCLRHRARRPLASALPRPTARLARLAACRLEPGRLEPDDRRRRPPVSGRAVRASHVAELARHARGSASASRSCARVGRGGEAAVGQPVDAAASAPAARRSGTGRRRRRGSSASPGSPRRPPAPRSTISRTSTGTSVAERGAQLGQRRRVRRAALPVQELYFHLIEQPTGLVSGLATGRPASTSSSAARSQLRVQRRVAVVGVRRAAVDDARRVGDEHVRRRLRAPGARDLLRLVVAGRARRTRPRRRAPSSPRASRAGSLTASLALICRKRTPRSA